MHCLAKSEGRTRTQNLLDHVEQRFCDVDGALRPAAGSPQPAAVGRLGVQEP